MTYQWTENTKPDRPGIWQEQGFNHPHWVTEKNLSTCPRGTWCFLMDLPDIKDPPRYRDVCQGDVGREVEVFIQGQWRLLRCFGVSREGLVAYEGDYCDGVAASTRCRILDDGQPKREPTPSAEFWLNVYEDYCHMHPSQAEADAKAYKHRQDCFKVKRVD